MQDSSKTVNVSIFGQQYSIRTTADARFIENVARYVNEHMDEVKASARDSSSQLRIAVLAAMNITAELFTVREDSDRLLDQVEAKTLAIREYIDDKITATEAG